MPKSENNEKEAGAKQTVTEEVMAFSKKKEEIEKQRKSDKKSGKAKPKSSTKKPKKTPSKKEEIKLEITFDDLLKRLKKIPVELHTDKSNFTAIRPKIKGGPSKVITYVQMTKKGISYYTKDKATKVWKIATKKLTTIAELDKFFETIEKTVASVTKKSSKSEA